MGPLWQHIAVYLMLVIAGAIAIWSGISAWQAIKRGECGSCPGCNGQPRDAGSAPPDAKERLVFLPSDDLRRHVAAGKRNRTDP